MTEAADGNAPAVPPPSVWSDKDALGLLPVTSRDVYWKAWCKLKTFCKDNFFNGPPSENQGYAWLEHLRTELGFKASTIHRELSMVNAAMTAKYNRNFNAYPRLRSYLKVNTSKDETVKANTFNMNQMKDICRAGLTTDDDKVLVDSVIAVAALFGGMRCKEASGLKRKNVKFTDDGVVIDFIRLKKRKRNDCRRVRCLIPSKGDFDWSAVFKRYWRKSEPYCTGKETDSVWVNHHKRSGFKTGFMGYAKIGLSCRNMCLIIGILELGFSFHSYRRTAATMCANSGATSEQMCLWFGWESVAMVREYVSASTASMQDFASSLGDARITMGFVGHNHDAPVLRAAALESSGDEFQTDAIPVLSRKYSNIQPMDVVAVEIVSTEDESLENKSGAIVIEAEEFSNTQELAAAPMDATEAVVAMEAMEAEAAVVANTVEGAIVGPDVSCLSLEFLLTCIENSEEMPRKSKLSKYSTRIWNSFNNFKSAVMEDQIGVNPLPTLNQFARSKKVANI